VASKRKGDRSKLQTVIHIVNSAGNIAGYWEGGFQEKADFCSAFYAIDPLKDLTQPELVKYAVQLIQKVQEKRGDFRWNQRRLLKLTNSQIRKSFKKTRKSKGLVGSSPTQDIIDEFYQSWDWKRLRYDFFKDKKRLCQCCGATPDDGIRIVIDHIKPIRHYWDLRLDPKNLQCLCNDCNMGKGSRDETDWRA